MKTHIDLANPKNVELLQAALIAAFPQCERYLSANPRPDSTGICLAYEQAAWADVSYGWQPEHECPPQVRCTQTQYKPCPIGGRFYRDSYSIGD